LRGFVRHVILTAESRAAGDEEMTDKGSERLGDQLQKVIAAGLTKPEAERAICARISAGEIRVWRRIEKIYPEKENFVYRRPFWTGRLKHLFPHDIDWEKSLFTGQLGRITDDSPLFHLKWIELCNEGVRRLCNEISWTRAGIQEAGAVNGSGDFGHSLTPEPPRRSEPLRKAHGTVPAANGDASKGVSLPGRSWKKGSPLDDRLRLEIKALFPNGVPGLADLSNPGLCDLVRKTLGKTKRPVSDSTILRAAGRKRARMRQRPPA
jgi:hypothetical protein